MTNRQTLAATLVAIAYVGFKEDGETAFAKDAGVERFNHGDVVDVPQALAAKMLAHPDVFALEGSEDHQAYLARRAGTPQEEVAAPAAPAPAPAPSEPPAASPADSAQASAPAAAPAGPDPTEGMDVDALRALVKLRGWGSQVPGYAQMGEDKLRPKVVELLTANPTE